ncbi:hypothetical protein GCM10009839_12670 [Catenulispora yoronensis]|uniref:Integral membrane protein n=1 Tax=Catenulispora yoronensis TaxID=450799 RepID=A0ABP5F7R0_9ACTN
MARKQQAITPDSARRIGRVFAVLAGALAMAMVWAAFTLKSANDDKLRFDAAPLCTGTANERTTVAQRADSCKAEVPAVVAAVRVTAGKNRIATVTLTLAGGAPIATDVKPYLAPDIGDSVTAILWHGRCAVIRTEGNGDVATSDSPARHVSNDDAGFLIGLAVTVALEAVAGLFLTYFLVEHERMVPAYLLSGFGLFIAVVASLAHNYAVTFATAFAVPLWVLGVFVVWPRLAWTRQRNNWQWSKEPL